MQLNTFLLAIVIVFTLVIFIIIGLILRQVSHSKWIDSRASTMLYVLLIFIGGLLFSLWASYLFYIGIFA